MVTYLERQEERKKRWGTNWRKIESWWNPDHGQKKECLDNIYKTMRETKKRWTE